jgi:hypothetical protein
VIDEALSLFVTEAASMADNVKPSPLPGFEPERDWAKRRGVNQRTPARLRQEGKVEYLEWGGRIWLNTASADAVIRSRVKRRNPARRRRASPEIQDRP